MSRATDRPLPQRRYITIADAAEYTGVHHRTIRRWIHEGRLTGYSFSAQIIRIDLHELDQLARPIPATRKDG